MTHIPYFTFYPADFMDGVRGMTPQEVGVYTMLLCRIYNQNGPVEYHARKLATYCGMREATFLKTLESLVDLGKITLVDGMLFNGRADREISKRANDLKNYSKAGKASAEKRQQNQRQNLTNVEQSFNHTDTDTDIEKEEGKPSSKKSPRRCPLPEGWIPNERNIQHAISQQFSEREIKDEGRKFYDHHRAKGSTMLDWDAAWRTWIGNARQWAKPPNRSAGGGTVTAFAAVAARNRSHPQFG